MPVLVDAGRSRWGWSRRGSFMHCMQLGAYTELLEMTLGDDHDPLDRGKLGHVGAAHQYARWRAQQRKEDPEVFYPREAAMEVYAAQNPECAPHLGLMIDVLRRYFQKNPEPPGRIHTVEDELVGVIGWCRTPEGAYVLDTRGAPRYDLWLADPAACVTLVDTQPLTSIPAVGGGTIIPAPLDVPGHARHGCPVLLSRRLDLAYDAFRSGETLVLDHKFTRADISANRAWKYAPDGQFAADRILSRQAFPRFTNEMWINLIGVTPPNKIRALPVPGTPWRDATHAYQVHMRMTLVARLERDGVSPWHFPRADHELVCSDRYGGCLARFLCDYGPGAAPVPAPPEEA